MRSVLVLPLLVACGSELPPTPSVDVSGLIAGIDGLSSAEGTCLRQQCETVKSAEEFASCRADSCEKREDAWSLVPTTIRHEGETGFVQARLGYSPGGYGPIDAPRSEEAYVGCTLITSEGAEIDLAVTTIFPNDLERPFTLSSDVGPDVRDVIFGVWDRKIEPCDSERMGCVQFGFLLDGSLATWPPTAYQDGTRQRILPGVVDVIVLDGGVGPAFSERRTNVVDALNRQLAVFGSKVGKVRSALASAASELIVVAHADDHDRLLARQLSSELGGSDDRVFNQADLKAPFEVTIGGTAAMFDKARQAGCASTQNAAFDECVAGL